MANKIQLLPDNIANQIAAGEVVQRPASIVKELLENAIDAGATQVTLHIKEAGKTFIQVIDNGGGMSETDARMCFERHATSKIRKIDDLFSIHTFGFRGEAMASIAAVARVELKTRQGKDDIGTQVIVEDTKVLEHEPCSTVAGTSITVKNLFFNVPARKNFLKSNKVERKHILEEFIRAAIPNPNIKMVFLEDGKEEYHLTSGSLKQRIVQLFGKRLEEGLIPVEETSSIVNVSGFVAKPEFAKKMRGEQYFLANNRFIKSPYFHHSIMGAYDDLLPPDHFPLYVLFLEVEPSRLDVNVHPTKTEVKFEEEKAIYSILRTSIRKALSEHHAGPSLSFEKEDIVENSWLKPTKQTSTSGSSSPSWTSGGASSSKNTGESHQSSSRPSNAGNWKDLYKILETQSETPSETQQSLDYDESRIKHPFQVAGKFIVASMKNGLLVVNQRKAHQRILYERFLSRKEQGACQKLLFPENIEFNLQEKALFQELDAELHQLGFDISPFGQNAYLIHGVPTDVSQDAAEKTVHDLLNIYANSQFADTLSLSDKLARSLAKCSSVREGSLLEKEEMSHLLDELFACEMPYYHFDGSPTLVNMDVQELDKRFEGI